MQKQRHTLEIERWRRASLHLLHEKKAMRRFGANQTFAHQKREAADFFLGNSHSFCGSEPGDASLVREGFIPDDTSSVDVPAPSRTSSLPQVRISIDQLAIISFHHHCASVLGAHSLYEPGALRARERLSCSGLLWERTCSRKLCFERQPPCECTPIPANKCLLRQHCPSQQIHKSSTPIHHAWPAICMTASRYPRRVPCHTPILGRCGRPLA
ncbi:hypothetical protein ALP64_201669 [Pseudomonas syringae pv. actinidiae]|nr:hypothetical protein ALP64_201669 [Pseudomonas syringae pv. actinidiae]